MKTELNESAIFKVSRRDFLKSTSMSMSGLLLGISFSCSETSKKLTGNPAYIYSPNLFVTLNGNGDVTLIAHRSEMGTGIFGIEAAAQNYFKKPAKKLSRQEAAMIASCMPNPKKYTVKPLSRYVASRYPWVMRQMTHLQNDPDIQKILQ